MTHYQTNISKCKIVGLGSLKRVLEAVCGLKSINLTTDNIKVLDVHFSYNSTLKEQNNFLDTVKSTKQVLRFRNMTVIPNLLIKELQNIQKILYGALHIQTLVTKHYVAIFKMVG